MYFQPVCTWGLSVSLQVLLTHHKEAVKIHLRFVCHLPVPSPEAVLWKISSVSWKQLFCFLEM